MQPLWLAVSVAGLAVAMADKPCCQGKCTSGYDKYWSLSKGLDGTKHCGETCLSASSYHLHKEMGWNLTWANSTSNPCKDLGFTDYDASITHDYRPVSMTLDMYSKPPPPDNHCCVGKCTNGEDKYWSITKGKHGHLICGETCLSSTKYYTVHVVEWNLTWANGTASPCKSFGYINYDKTVSHSFGLFTVTSDIYKSPPPTPAHEFERGVMAALGFQDGKDCFEGAHEVAGAMWATGQRLRTGGAIARAEALGRLAEEAKNIVETIESCSTAVSDVMRYAELVKNLKDPRFYTLHNALTLALNLADDRKMLETFVDDLDQQKYFAAGEELIETVLDVLARPGIPESNSSAAIDIATGMIEGFGEKLEDIQCFKDLSVEIPDLLGGTMQCVSGIGMISGLETLFYGISGIVPTFEDCFHDRHKVMNILESFGKFKDPHKTARFVEQNMVKHGLDVSIHLTQAVLAAKDQEWHNFGTDIGKFLSDVALNITVSSTEVIV